MTRPAMHAASGIAFTDDGAVVSWADYIAFQQRYDLTRQTIQNGAVEFGKRCPVPSAQSTTGWYYGFTVPEGRRLYIWRRDLYVTEGRYEVDLIQYPDGFTGGTPAFRKPLAQGAPQTVGAELFCGVTPIGSGTTILELPLIDTGTGQTGQARAQGAGAADGVLKSFTDGTVLIRVRRTVAADFISSIGLIAWEEDA